MISELESQEAIPFENAENEFPPKAKVPREVMRADRNNDIRQTPKRKPSTQIRHGNEFPICGETTDLSMDFYLFIES